MIRKCRLFSNLLFDNMPDLSSYGIENITLYHPGNFAVTTEIPTVTQIQSGLSNASTPFVLDFEQWDEATELQNWIDTAVSVNEATNIPWGFYMIAPNRNYWSAIEESGSNYEAWQAQNDNAALIESDVMFPSLYTFYDDALGWMKYAVNNIREAKRISNGRKIYAYLWMQFHDSNAILKYQFISNDYWRMQLNLIRSSCDGLVLFGGFQYAPNFQRLEWDENAGWWLTFKDVFGLT